MRRVRERCRPLKGRRIPVTLSPSRQDTRTEVRVSPFAFLRTPIS